MRLLKYKGDENAPNEWRPISSKDLGKWRAEGRQRVAEGKSSRVVSVGTRNLPRADREVDDSAIIDKPADRGVGDPTETQRAVVEMYRDWINDPIATHTQRVARIQILRALSGKAFEHLSDGQIGEQLGTVSHGLARQSAERVYKNRGWDKATHITEDGVRVVDTKSRYNASEWAVPTGTAEPVDRRHRWQRSQDS